MFFVEVYEDKVYDGIKFFSLRHQTFWSGSGSRCNSSLNPDPVHPDQNHCQQHCLHEGYQTERKMAAGTGRGRACRPPC